MAALSTVHTVATVIMTMTYTMTNCCCPFLVVLIQLTLPYSGSRIRPSLLGRYDRTFSNRRDEEAEWLQN